MLCSFSFGCEQIHALSAMAGTTHWRDNRGEVPFQGDIPCQGDDIPLQGEATFEIQDFDGYQIACTL
jgi:hypothetical protein